MKFSINELERKIIGITQGIKNGTKQKENSGIGKYFIELKAKDEVIYNKLMQEYKKVIDKI